MKFSFKEKILEVVKKIPKGKTLSYKDVAESVGRPRAYRAVGNILNKNYDKNIPCHRVIRSDGAIGDYNRGRKKKKLILRMEKNKIGTAFCFKNNYCKMRKYRLANYVQKQTF